MLEQDKMYIYGLMTSCEEADLEEESLDALDVLDMLEIEELLAEETAEQELSQAQGVWLDGYLDAMDELEEEY